MTKRLSDDVWDFSDEAHDKYVPSCYESHPGLKIDGHLIYGGSCSHPVVKDADIYVALQHGSTSNMATDPWDVGEKKVIEVKFSIEDTQAPKYKHSKRFFKMIDWLCNQLHEGKKIHVGCIGGHGRTGMVLAAIVARLGEKDAITYVRKHYCKKAVESPEQVNFLHQHFGVIKVGGSKLPITSTFHSHSDLTHTQQSGSSHRTLHGSYSEAYAASRQGLTGRMQSPLGEAVHGGALRSAASETIRPMKSSRCLWNVRQ